ncbi:MAG: transketolase [Patescibacteria group bacterium]
MTSHIKSNTLKLMTINQYEQLAKSLRYWILQMTSTAGSGHVTSSLSAVELMAVLASHYQFDFDQPQNMHNDRLIFSKGHASPLYYVLYACMGAIGFDELWRYRQLDSTLEGHPTPRFKYTDFATGSLGMGLGFGSGLALGLSRLNSTGRVFVLLGDGELAEGSVWESAAFTSQHHLSNLTAIVDVNRLGQSAATAYGWDIKTYQHRFEAFGWHVITIDGHNIKEIDAAFGQLDSQKPTVILAKTVKGKGVSYLEDEPNWHGVALSEPDLDQALCELGVVQTDLTVKVAAPKKTMLLPDTTVAINVVASANSLGRNDKEGEVLSLRQVFGQTLQQICKQNEKIIVFDGDVANSTFTALVRDKLPDQFVETYIAEQQMIDGAVGISKAGFYPVVATFAAFLTRAFDQIRMSAISNANLLIVGTHTGVSIGQDGPSQMGLEDVAMFSSIHQSTIICPADAISTAKLLPELLNQTGIKYLRLFRPEVPALYSMDEKFEVGGSKILRESAADVVAIIASGVTVHEALKAYEMLKNENIAVKVVDAYSIKPIDTETLHQISSQVKYFVTVEDHRLQGGLGDAVLNAFVGSKSIIPHITKLGIDEIPRSGKPNQLMDKYGISAKTIYDTVKKIRS